MTRDRCLLCGVELAPLAHLGAQHHPASPACLVTYTDAYGVALTDREVAILETLIDDPPPEPEPPIGVFDLHPPVDYVLDQLFAAHGAPRLGGASTGKGWSSYAVAQRCLYLWGRLYVDKRPPEFIGEFKARAVGSLIHVFVALMYANQIGQHAAITPEVCRDFLHERANPAFVNEGWRVFEAYRRYYAHDDLEPLAIEYDLRDPRTGASCRYDLIAYLPTAKGGNPRGTYVIEHKSSARFDADTIDGWANDGEVIGEAALWKRLGLDKRFGPLRGVIVNLIGKQQEPKFHRTVIAPDSVLIDAHFKDLRRWDALIALCRSAGFWPRARANCVNRWGRCDLWDHCASGAP